jgi:hypothetical protein
MAEGETMIPASKQITDAQQRQAKDRRFAGMVLSLKYTIQESNYSPLDVEDAVRLAYWELFQECPGIAFHNDRHSVFNICVDCGAETTPETEWQVNDHHNLCGKCGAAAYRASENSMMANAANKKAFDEVVTKRTGSPPDLAAKKPDDRKEEFSFTYHLTENPDPKPISPEEIISLVPGLYRIFWTTGGLSVAAVGMFPSGDRWIAPTNWVNGPTDHWEKVARVELLATQESETHAAMQAGWSEPAKSTPLEDMAKVSAMIDKSVGYERHGADCWEDVPDITAAKRQTLRAAANRVFMEMRPEIERWMANMAKQAFADCTGLKPEVVEKFTCPICCKDMSVKDAVGDPRVGHYQVCCRECAKKIMAEIKAIAQETPIHLSSSPGRTACNSDEPNQRSTEILSAVTCKACLAIMFPPEYGNRKMIALHSGYWPGTMQRIRINGSVYVQHLPDNVPAKCYFCKEEIRVNVCNAVIDPQNGYICYVCHGCAKVIIENEKANA